MLFQITYDSQLVCENLELDEATQVSSQMNEEAAVEGDEPNYVVEQQMIQPQEKTS